MKNKLFLLLVTILAVASLAACGGKKMPEKLKAEDITGETLYIKANGTNQIAYVSDFDKQYYNVDELKSYLFGELSEYNKKYGEGVAEVSEVSLKGKTVTTILTFTNNKAYAEFSKAKSDKPISYPAFDKIFKEYGDMDFYSAGKEEVRKGKDALDKEKDNVVVVSGPILLKTEKAIKYFSAGNLVDEHNLSLGQAEEAVVIFGR